MKFQVSGIASQAVVMILAVVFAAGIGTVYFFQKEKAYPNPFDVACTQEAKLCPNGSAVGRTGPNCEFAPCPAEALCEGGPCPADLSAKAPATVGALCEGGECPKATKTQSIYKSIRDVDFQKVLISELPPDAGKDCEVYAQTQFADLDKDGNEEALVLGSTCFAGQGVPYDVQEVFKLTDDNRVVKLPVDRNGIPGRPSDLEIKEGVLFTRYSIFNAGDPNCCPSGGAGEIYFKWDGSKFVKDQVKSF